MNWARTREVYLPAGARWYDFYSGRAFEGGQSVEADAPLSRMPLFVRAGSIVPIGPAVQYTSENLDGPITLHVYTGADGAFDLYEDGRWRYALTVQNIADRIYVSPCLSRGDCWFGARRTAIASARYRF